jgi:hypothetical protein
MVAQFYNPSTQETEARGSQLRVILGCIPLSKNKPKAKNKASLTPRCIHVTSVIK